MIPEDLITAEFLTAALTKGFGDGYKLVSWNNSSCTKTDDNFFNVVKRISLICEADQVQKTVSLIAKLNPCKDEDSFNPYRQRAMKKEVFFYEDLLPLLNSELKKMGEEELRVPKYIHSSLKPGCEIIILEDLNNKGFKTFSKNLLMDEAHSILMAKEIGRLHAASFNLDKSLGERELETVFPLLVESWLIGDQRQREAFEDVFIKGMKLNTALANYLEGFENISIIDLLKGREMDTLVGELQYEKPWKAICHGDLHRTNVLFRYDERKIPVEVMILDWQTVRVATLASEINYLLFSSYFGPAREEYLSLITKSYYEAIGLNLLFTVEELQDKVKANSFGLLICFYLVPLSLTVNDPSELFNVEKDTKVTEDDARKLLNNNHRLKNVLCDYLKALQCSSLMDNQQISK